MHSHTFIYILHTFTHIYTHLHAFIIGISHVFIDFVAVFAMLGMFVVIAVIAVIAVFTVIAVIAVYALFAEFALFAMFVVFALFALFAMFVVFALFAVIAFFAVPRARSVLRVAGGGGAAGTRSLSYYQESLRVIFSVTS